MYIVCDFKCIKCAVFSRRNADFVFLGALQSLLFFKQFAFFYKNIVFQDIGTPLFPFEKV